MCAAHTANHTSASLYNRCIKITHDQTMLDYDQTMLDCVRGKLMAKDHLVITNIINKKASLHRVRRANEYIWYFTHCSKFHALFWTLGTVLKLYQNELFYTPFRVRKIAFIMHLLLTWWGLVVFFFVMKNFSPWSSGWNPPLNYRISNKDEWSKQGAFWITDLGNPSFLI